MENAQRILDRLAISGSLVCMIHCLATPLLLVALPIVSASFLADEDFHKVFVAIVLPVSIGALFLGCRRHRDGAVAVLGGLGLVLLVLLAWLGHDLLGSAGEKAGTIASGAIIALAHVRNYRLCRRQACEHEPGHDRH